MGLKDVETCIELLVTLSSCMSYKWCPKSYAGRILEDHSFMDTLFISFMIIVDSAGMSLKRDDNDDAPSLSCTHLWCSDVTAILGAGVV